jgi:hypothetical protein
MEDFASLALHTLWAAHAPTMRVRAHSAQLRPHQQSSIAPAAGMHFSVLLVLAALRPYPARVV